MCRGWMRNGESWSAAQRAVLVSVGCPDGTKAGLCCRPMPSGWSRNEARAFTGGSHGRPVALGTLAYGAFHPARLETRTKESNMYASRWAANPQRRK